MPTMPRIQGKTTGIAFKILGVPQNIAHRRTKKEQKINKALLFQETARVR